jgi:hypothetical protein
LHGTEEEEWSGGGDISFSAGKVDISPKKKKAKNPWGEDLQVETPCLFKDLCFICP